MDEQNVQYTVKNVHVFVPVFLYAVTMLIFQIKRIISSEKWFNYVVTLFFENTKNLGRSDDAKRRKKWIACLLITTALLGKFNIFVYQLSSTPINCSRRTTTALQGKLTWLCKAWKLQHKRNFDLKNSIKNNSASIKWELRKSKQQPKLSGSHKKKCDRYPIF